MRMYLSYLQGEKMIKSEEISRKKRERDKEKARQSHITVASWILRMEKG